MASRELIGAFLAEKWKTQAKDVILPEPGCPLSACTSALLVLLLLKGLGPKSISVVTHDLFFPHP